MNEKISDDSVLPNQEIIYGTANGENLVLDLFLPDESLKKSVPCVVFVHGGGWSGGSRSQFHWHARQLANQGYVTASVGYRLSGIAKYPAALDDCQQAVRWLRKNSSLYHIDPTRIGAMGSSAGGHLVACLGVRDTRDNSIEELKDFSSRVQCVVDVHGIHDMPSLVGTNLESQCIIGFLGDTFKNSKSVWEDASPIRFISDQTAPMLIIHDPHDTVVPYDDSVKFANALMMAHRPIEFMPVPHAGHGFVYNPQKEWTQKVWPIAVAWLKRFLQN